ncbi:DNA adenine methylase [Phenylobacterium sp. SCN 70-31]|uniref:DNA adenine methylase n=1 Tax=Phenylobacterium sp. SCN 70-31 TaxID=1660129 RepID=UPI00086F73C2|nr:DNA adenine methylase [Phenylobacterium sp. SCN 70-31]ODT88125.1 MAG: DNA methyltransferase [Phenylobacterium sp. SCN 70-31]
MNAPVRPLLRYLGSKWRLAPQIVAELPPHGLYIEAFGGSAAVLAHKPRCNSEIWNDLDGEVVNLFQVLRSPASGDRLLELLALTPYARAEHELSYEAVDDPVERARRLLVRSHMGHGNNGTQTHLRNGWRVDGVTNTNDVAGQWAKFPDSLRVWIDRLRGVQIERRPAVDLIEKFSVAGALLYLDPPYVPETRSASVRWSTGKCAYAHEMTLADHEALLELVLRSPAMIVLSGYGSDLYDTALKGWRRVTIKARAHGNKPRLEVLWINPAASAASGGLFQ